MSAPGIRSCESEFFPSFSSFLATVSVHTVAYCEPIVLLQRQSCVSESFDNSYPCSSRDLRAGRHLHPTTAVTALQEAGPLCSPLTRSGHSQRPRILVPDIRVLGIVDRGCQRGFNLVDIAQVRRSRPSPPCAGHLVFWSYSACAELSGTT